MKKKLIIILGVVLGLLLLGGVLFYVETRGLDDATEVYFTVKQGDNKLEIVSNLKESDIIRSKYFTLLYVVLKPGLNLQAGTYKINKTSSSIDIINQIGSGNTRILADTKRIIFYEGTRITDYAKTIEEVLGIKKEDFLNTVNDKDFLKRMQEKYDFLTDEIYNKDIYYALEGYLAPDTYEFYEKTTSEEIIDKMLANMKKRLESIKDDFSQTDKSIHEILTIASIIEDEAVKDNDRAMVSQVIYKRLAINMALGMDTTTGYGARIEKGQKVNKYLNDVNGYNTRNVNFKGLPVGAICNPSKNAILHALHPADTDYLYFASDNNGKVFFVSNETEWNILLKQLGLR